METTEQIYFSFGTAEGKVVATVEKKSHYHIALGTGETEWYAVSNITSLTLQEEQKRRKTRHKAQGIVDHQIMLQNIILSFIVYYYPFLL